MNIHLRNVTASTWLFWFATAPIMPTVLLAMTFIMLVLIAVRAHRTFEKVLAWCWRFRNWYMERIP